LLDSIHTRLWTFDCGNGCEVAAAAETSELVLFHHDPAYTDDLWQPKNQPHKVVPDSHAAYEGLEIKLKADPKVFLGKPDEKLAGKFWLKHSPGHEETFRV